MNAYAIFILVALLGGFLLNLVADLLNLRALRPELPREMAGSFDAEEYRRSQEYTRARTRFGLLRGTVSLAALLAFWFAGGFPWLESLVSGWSLTTPWHGLAYIGLLAGASTLLGLPFAVYGTFVIEERFGFNKTTPPTFVMDRIKGLALTVLLGGPLLAAVLLFFENAGPAAWLYCWAAATAFSLFLQFVAPTWILPLFNKFEPLEEGELRAAILAMADRARFPLANVFVMDGSRRSTKSNAFFTGFGSTKRIALFDTLVEEHSVPELVGVLAHEVGHYKKKHVLKGIGISVAHTGVLLFLLSLFLSEAGLFQAFFVEEPGIHAGLIFFGMLYTPVELFLSLALHALSRRHEYQADQYAAELTGDPASLGAALRKLARRNLSNLTPHPFYVALHYTHPPLLRRLAALLPADSPGGPAGVPMAPASPAATPDPGSV